MLGAGIYGLIGKAAGEMGNAIWLAFLVSMVAAMLTGLSYASIACRYPKAAGAAYVTQRAYRQVDADICGRAGGDVFRPHLRRDAVARRRRQPYSN